MNHPLVAIVGAYVAGLLLVQGSHPSFTALWALLLALALLFLLAVCKPPNPGRKPDPDEANSSTSVADFPSASSPHPAPPAPMEERVAAGRERWRPHLTRWRNYFRSCLLWALLAMAGALNLTLRTTVLFPTDLRARLGAEPVMATVRGWLAETPRQQIRQRHGQEIWHSAAFLSVSSLRREKDFEPVTGKVLVTAPDVLGPAFFTGQSVEIAGVLIRPAPPLAEGLFDFRTYLAMHGVYYQLRTSTTNDWQVAAPARDQPPYTDRFLLWAHETLALGLPVEDEPLRLLWAMTLGWRTAFTGDIGDPFLRAGTMHMFAIDGLRIALVSGLMVTLLRVLRVSRAWCGAVAIPVIWFYTAATGWPAPAIRASVMMTIVLGGWALKRPVDLLNSLAAAAGILLLADPRQLFESSFQLSFLVMLVIALALPRLNALSDRLLRAWLQPDPLLPEALVPRWRQRLLPATQNFGRFVGLSLAAWLGSLPLAAKYFHLFSPVSTLANLVAVPIGALALTANLGALLCGHWLPWITGLFNQAAWFLMMAMTWVSIEFARLPGAYCYVPEPSLGTIALYYAVLCAACSGWFRTARRRWAGAAALVLIAAIYFVRWELSRGETDLTVLPLNGGLAIYVDADGRRNDWLINCGNAEAANSTLKDYLRGQGVNSLPRLVLADGTTRDCGGAKGVDELFPVGELWTSAANFRSPAYRQAVAAFEAVSAGGRPSRHKVLRAGDTQGLWEVMFPPESSERLLSRPAAALASIGDGGEGRGEEALGESTAPEPNSAPAELRSARTVAKADDAGLVLRGNFHGTRILMLPDLGRAGQSELLAQSNDLRAEIVIAGLPSAGEPLCDALLAAVQPRVIVVADSEYPAARRASAALHARLDQKGWTVYYTRAAGAVKIVMSSAAGNAEVKIQNEKLKM